MEEQNGRASKETLKTAVIASVENTLKEKFKTMKCHVIGSHRYNIAKGGLAPLNIYLDLREFYSSFPLEKLDKKSSFSIHFPFQTIVSITIKRVQYSWVEWTMHWNYLKRAMTGRTQNALSKPDTVCCQQNISSQNGTVNLYLVLAFRCEIATSFVVFLRHNQLVCWIFFSGRHRENSFN